MGSGKLGVLGAVVLLGAGVVVGCSSSSSGGGGGGECSAACQHVVSCDPSTTQSECESYCKGAHFSTACTDALKAASCADVQQGPSQSPAWANTCFPPCTGTTATCSGSDIAACSDGHSYDLSCPYVCSLNGKQFSGTCAASYSGQSCSNGTECCWCQ
jgi:hypothetical protein